MTRTARVAVAAALLAAVGAALMPAVQRAVAARQEIGAGQALYGQYCAACHGADLRGQPDWTTPKSDGKLPAPPHDASGHTWHHSDKLLAEIVRRGMAAYIGQGYKSDMPAFAGVLDDSQIAAILAYIGSKWPDEERAFQADRTIAERP